MLFGCKTQQRQKTAITPPIQAPITPKAWELVQIGSNVKEYPIGEENQLKLEHTNIYNYINSSSSNWVTDKIYSKLIYTSSPSFSSYADTIWNEAKSKASSPDLQSSYATEKLKSTFNQLDKQKIIAEVSTYYYNKINNIRSKTGEYWYKRNITCEKYDPGTEVLTFKNENTLEPFKFALSTFDKIRTNAYSSWRSDIKRQVEDEWDRTFYQVYPARGYTYTKETYKYGESGKWYEEDINNLLERRIRSLGGMPDSEWKSSLSVWDYKEISSGKTIKTVICNGSTVCSML